MTGGAAPYSARRYPVLHGIAALQAKRSGSWLVQFPAQFLDWGIGGTDCSSASFCSTVVPPTQSS